MLPVLLLTLAGLDEPMPPPPPGLVLLAQATIVPDAGLTSTDAGLEPQPVALQPREEEEPEADADLEAMRALEEVTIDPKARSGASIRATLGQLGYGSLTRDRLENALEASELSGEELAFQLDSVTNVETFDVLKVQDRYDIPVEMNALVAQYIHFFQGGGRKWFRK